MAKKKKIQQKDKDRSSDFDRGKNIQKRDKEYVKK